MALQAALPKNIPVEDRVLAVFPDRELPDILWYGENMSYSLVAPKEPAPLIFVIAGTGASYNSKKFRFCNKPFPNRAFMFSRCPPLPIPTLSFRPPVPASLVTF